MTPATSGDTERQLLIALDDLRQEYERAARPLVERLEQLRQRPVELECIKCDWVGNTATCGYDRFKIYCPSCKLTSLIRRTGVTL